MAAQRYPGEFLMRDITMSALRGMMADRSIDVTNLNADGLGYLIVDIVPGDYLVSDIYPNIVSRNTSGLLMLKNLFPEVDINTFKTEEGKVAFTAPITPSPRGRQKNPGDRLIRRVKELIQLPKGTKYIDISRMDVNGIDFRTVDHIPLGYYMSDEVPLFITSDLVKLRLLGKWFPDFTDDALKTFHQYLPGADEASIVNRANELMTSKTGQYLDITDLNALGKGYRSRSGVPREGFISERVPLFYTKDLSKLRLLPQWFPEITPEIISSFRSIK